MTLRRPHLAFALILAPVLALACGDDAADPPADEGTAGTAGTTAKGGSSGKGGSSSSKGGTGGSTAGKGGTGGDGESGTGGKGGKGGASGKGGSDNEGGKGGEASGGSGGTAGAAGKAAGGTSAAGAAGSEAAGAAGAAGAGGEAGAAGQVAGGAAGSAGAAGAAAGNGGAAGTEAGGSAGAGGVSGDPTKTRLRFVVLSEAMRNFPLDICWGQNLKNPNGDDDGYIGPIAETFTESIVSPQITRYVANTTATPLLGGVPIVIRVVNAFTDCKKANRVVGTNDDTTASLVTGVDNTILLVDTPNNGKTLQASVLTDPVAPPASAIVRMLGGVYQKGIELYSKGPADGTKLLGSAAYGKPSEITLAAGTTYPNFVVATTGGLATGIQLPGATFAAGTTYSVLASGKADSVGEVFASVCADDKAVPTKSNYTVKACVFTPNPEGGD